MNLTRFLVGRPLLTSMFFGAIALMGAAAAVQLPVSDLPDVDFPFIVIQIENPGASASTIKQDVTDKVEQAISQLGSINEITGASSTGVSTVIVQLTQGTDVDTAAADIAQAINRAARSFPEGVTSPAISKINPTATPILTVNFSGSDTGRLSDLVSEDVVPALQLVDGVGQVSVVGQRRTTTEVVLDADRLAARGLTVPQVTQAIITKNVTLPAGTAESGDLSSQVRLTGQATSRAELADVVVGVSGEQRVRLSDVATLSDAPAKLRTASLLDGAPTVGLAITPKTGANAITTVAGAKKALEAIKAQLPPGTRMVITTDTTVFTRAAVKATAEDLFLAVILAGTVILLFLQSIRQTLIVLVAIPTSLLATTLMMAWFNFSLDTMSLLAMTLLIGILVDDAVVVIENITRHLHAGEDVVEAAVVGRTEIGGAAVALTLTDVVVFAPIALSPGLIGDILIEIALTVVVATLFSLLVSFTLTPMLAAAWLKPNRRAVRRPNPISRALAGGMTMLERGYARVLRVSLRHRITVLLVGVGVFAGCIGLVTTGRIGVNLAPESDSNALFVQASMPSGTSLAASTSAMTTLSTRVQQAMPTDVVSVYATVGSAEGFVGTASNGEMTINLVDKNRRSADLETLKQRVLGELSRVPGLQGTVSSPSPFGQGGNNELPVVLRGPSQEKVQELSRTVTALLAARPELQNVTSLAAQSAPSWDITLDQDAAGRFGVTPQQIAATVAAATDGSDLGSIRTESGVDQPVTVSIAADAGGPSQDDLRALPVALANPAGGAEPAAGPAAGGAQQTSTSPPGRRIITLGQVASITRGSSPQTITDYDQQPQVTISTRPARGVASSEAQKAIAEAMTAAKLPAGYSYLLAGAAQVQADAFTPLFLALALAPILIYMLLAALYESLVLPFAVLLALPLAVVGALLALLWGGSTLNLFSLIGLVMLVGLVSKNAILLIDRAEVQRRAGRTAVEALVEAGRTRLRPIIMTTVTLVVAMLPIALINSPGSEYRAPMGLVLIGGMSSSTLLTLLVVPTLYTLLDAARERIPRGLRGLLHGRVPGRSSRQRPDVRTADLPTSPTEPDTDPEGLLLPPGGPAGPTRKEGEE